MLGIDFFAALTKQGKPQEYARVLRDVLMSESEQGDRLLPWLFSVELRGRGGLDTMSKLLESRRFQMQVGNESFQLSPSALSQGYQSMVSWISDMLGQAFLEFGSITSAADLQGIALIDEIDLHLHPTWQRRIVPILKRVFPRMQFVVTTHSPLVLTGFENDEIIGLELEGAHVVQRKPVLQPAAMSASEILGSFFDVTRAARPDLVEKERRYVELVAMSQPTKRQQDELRELERALADYWPASARESIEEDRGEDRVAEST